MRYLAPNLIVETGIPADERGHLVVVERGDHRDGVPGFFSDNREAGQGPVLECIPAAALVGKERLERELAGTVVDDIPFQ